MNVAEVHGIRAGQADGGDEDTAEAGPTIEAIWKLSWLSAIAGRKAFGSEEAWD